MTLNLGWFSTARGSGSLGMFTRVLDAINRKELDAKIKFVFSNRERGENERSDAYFDLVEAQGIPLITNSSRKFREQHNGNFADHRVTYDQENLRLLKVHNVDFSVLAGYMLIWSKDLCTQFKGINLHPALPNGPIGMWQEVIWELIEDWSLESGVNISLVTENLDRGPTLSYTKFPIRGWRFDHHWMALNDRKVTDIQGAEGEMHPLFRAIRQEGIQREPHLLLATLKALGEETITINDSGEVLGKGTASLPLNLTNEVEAALDPTETRPSGAP